MDIYKTYYLRNLFYMHRKKTGRISANLLQVAISGGRIDKII